MSDIHATAIISPKANLHSTVSVGPYCVIGDDVTINEACELSSHVVIEGRTTIGKKTKISPFVSLGGAPQSLKDEGAGTALSIGENCTIREHVSIHRGTKLDESLTKIGNNCYIMSNSHVGHDCKVGNNVIMANATNVGGHVSLGDAVNIGGLTAIHQFIRIGNGVMIGGGSTVVQDVPPFLLVTGERAAIRGLNLVGLKRQGLDKKSLRNIQKFIKSLFADGATLQERIVAAKKEYENIEICAEILNFIEAPSKFGICLPKNR